MKKKLNTKDEIETLKLLCSILIQENTMLKNEIAKIMDSKIDDIDTFLHQVIKK